MLKPRKWFYGVVAMTILLLYYYSWKDNIVYVAQSYRCSLVNMSVNQYLLTHIKPLEVPASNPDDALYELQKAFTVKLISLRKLVLSQVQCNSLQLYDRIKDSGVSKQLKLVNPTHEVDYWASIDKLTWIKSISYTCTVHHTRYKQSENHPFCGIPHNFKFYKFGLSKPHCYHKNSYLNVSDCLSRVNLQVTMQEEDFAYEKVDTSQNLYMHVIPLANIDSNGNVKTGSSTIIPKSCFAESGGEVFNRELSRTNNYRHQEVFIITQKWSHAFYHATIEGLPRLGIYIDFLHKFDHIKIHIHYKSYGFMKGLLRAIGITVDRLVMGAVFADVVYFPKGGGCGQTQLPGAFFLTSHLQRYVEDKLLSKTDNPHTNSIKVKQISRKEAQVGAKDNSNNHNTVHSNKNNLHIKENNNNKAIHNEISINNPAKKAAKNIILLKRTSTRWYDSLINKYRRFIDHNDFREMSQYLDTLARDNGMEFHIIDDNKPPSQDRVMTLFHKAGVVVGLHGAGLSNVLHCKPGAFMVEVMCTDYTNFCYTNLSQALGLRHYILVSEGFCKGAKVDLKAFKEAVTFFVDKITKN